MDFDRSSKKKKHKDHRKKSAFNSIGKTASSSISAASSSSSSSSHHQHHHLASQADNIPNNLRIKQQFEFLQQQQLQQQQQQQQQQLQQSVNENVASLFKVSDSSQSISIPTCIQIPVEPASYSSASSHGLAPGSTPPAFKALFRNLRVGSLKNPPQAAPTTTTTITVSNKENSAAKHTSGEQVEQFGDQTSTDASKHLMIMPFVNVSANLGRSSNNTFKPSLETSPTKINTPTSTATAAAASFGGDLKTDYLNCINQLQTIAAQAAANSNKQASIKHNQISPAKAASGLIAAPSTPTPTVAHFSLSASTTASPSSHASRLAASSQSNSATQQQHGNNKTPVMSTFIPMSATTTNATSAPAALAASSSSAMTTSFEMRHCRWK